MKFVDANYVCKINFYSEQISVKFKLCQAGENQY